MRLGSKLAVVVLLAAGPVYSQDFWEKKPFTEWNKDQCNKVLRDSPWSKTFAIANVKEDSFSQPTQGEGRGETEQKISYYIQLRGALPVRQAVVRSAMIHNKYDKMSSEEKKVVDQNSDRYLNSSPRFLIVHVDYETNVQYFDRALAEYWQSWPDGSMPANVYLTTSSGKRISPINWKYERGGGRAFEFYFPREVDGAPIITDEDKTFSIEFPNPRIRELSDRRAFVQFKTDKMKYKGELIF